MKALFIILLCLMFIQFVVTQHNFNYQRPQNGKRNFIFIFFIQNYQKYFIWNVSPSFYDSNYMWLLHSLFSVHLKLFQLKPPQILRQITKTVIITVIKMMEEMLWKLKSHLLRRDQMLKNWRQKEQQNKFYFVNHSSFVLHYL